MSSADVVIHKFVEETTIGVTPTSPALTKLNVVSSSIDGTIGTTVSNQINPNRSESDLIRTEGSTAGDIAVEWQYAAYDSFIEGALGSDFSSFTVTGTDIAAVATDNSLTASGTSVFSTSLLAAGMWIKISGFTGTAANNDIAKIVSVAPTKLVLSGITLVNDAAGESVTVKSNSIRNNLTRKSYTIEKEFSDLTTTFCSHKGCVVNTMNLSAAVGSIVTGSFGFNGTTTAYATTTVGTGTEIAAVSNQVFDPTDSIGVIYIDGTTFASCVRSINLTTTNNTRFTQCLGSLYPTNVNLGTLGVTGDMEIYFNSYTMIEKFLAGTAISLSYSFSDAAGNYLVIDLPNVKFNSGSLSGLSKQSDVMVSLSFTALYDSVEGYAIQISSLGA